MRKTNTLRVHQNKEKGGDFYHRINPFNPLSYFSLAAIYIIAIILFGWKDFKGAIVNPFKWKKSKN